MDIQNIKAKKVRKRKVSYAQRGNNAPEPKKELLPFVMKPIPTIRKISTYDFTPVVNNMFVEKDESKGIARVYITVQDPAPVSVELW